MIQSLAMKKFVQYSNIDEGISISELTTPTDSEGNPYNSYVPNHVFDAGTVHLWMV